MTPKRKTATEKKRNEEKADPSELGMTSKVKGESEDKSEKTLILFPQFLKQRDRCRPVSGIVIVGVGVDLEHRGRASESATERFLTSLRAAEPHCL
jgi:hypothetical protein